MRSSEIIPKLARKLLVLLLPFVIYAGVVAAIDPFDYFGNDFLVPRPVKATIAPRINAPLYLLLQFRKRPTGNVLLGDSRMGLFDTAWLRQFTGKPFANLSYGAATLNEMIGTFWQVTEQIKPDSVYIGIGLDHYNKLNNRNRVAGVTSILNNPLLYFSNYNVLETCYLVSKASITGDAGPSGQPEMSREEFWAYQLQTTAPRYLAQWIYPREYFEKLHQISRYCTEQHIRLVFVVMPVHTDLQALTDTFGLRSARTRFLADLAGMGDVYDFEIPGPLTNDRNNFRDPFHADPKVIRQIAGVIFHHDTVCNPDEGVIFRFHHQPKAALIP